MTKKDAAFEALKESVIELYKKLLIHGCDDKKDDGMKRAQASLKMAEESCI